MRSTNTTLAVCLLLETDMLRSCARGIAFRQRHAPLPPSAPAGPRPWHRQRLEQSAEPAGGAGWPPPRWAVVGHLRARRVCVLPPCADAVHGAGRLAFCARTCAQKGFSLPCSAAGNSYDQNTLRRDDGGFAFAALASETGCEKVREAFQHRPASLELAFDRVLNLC